MAEFLITAANQAAAEGLVREFPFVPSIDGPLGGPGLFLGPPGEPDPPDGTYRWQYAFKEAQIDLLRSIVIAEGAQAHFTLEQV
jgi:hypothetical protein